MIVFRSATKQLPRFHLYEQIRNIPRWSSRTPKKVYFPEEAQEVQNEAPAIIKKFEYPTTFSFKNKKPLESDSQGKTGGKLEILTLRKGRKKKEETVTTDMLETVIDAEGNLIYTKMDNNDARVARILSNLKSEKTLKKQESILLEGKRLIQDALKSGCKLQYLLFSRKSDIDDLKELPTMGAQLYKMPYREMQMWSDLTTCPGIMGVFKIPNPTETSYDIPVNVICDNIREPGNLGAILRSCAGAGCKEVILTKGCCDVWSSKVLRSATGAHFKLKITKSNWDEIKEKLSDTNWFIADNNLVKTSKNSSIIIDLMNTIPIESYDKLEYSSSREISLVIGGETEGISEEAYSIVGSIGGMRLNIPLGNNIESLNSGTALAVLIFEMRRQMYTQLYSNKILI